MITRYRLEAEGENLEDVRLDLDEVEFPILREAVTQLPDWDAFKEIARRRDIELLDESVGDGEALRRLVHLLNIIPTGDIPKRVVREEHISPGGIGYVGRRVVAIEWDDRDHAAPELNTGQSAVILMRDSTVIGPFGTVAEAKSFAIDADDPSHFVGSRTVALWDPDVFLAGLEKGDMRLAAL